MSGEFYMKFLKPKDADPDPKLLEAFNMLKEHGLTPQWIDQAQCLAVEGPDKNCAYVLDPFEGPAFEHLKLLSCRVYGAQCILASLNMKVQMPQKKRPIYNVAMKGVTVSCTSMDKKSRDHVHHLVELMAGEASRSLTDEVTHLVAGEVGSQKYAVAASRGISIMTVSWVNDVWEKAKHRYVHATDTDFAKFRCPVFKGLVVTVSGLSPDERKQVKQYVESEGGTYTGEMKMNECTHLIVKEPKGQKYDYACKWKVHIVTLRWLYESLDKNFCQDEKKYPVTGNRESSSVKTSTPERSRLSAVKPNIADISAISATHIDETAFTRTRLGDTTMETFEVLDLTCAPAELFLLSCRVYISQAIKGPLLDKCRTIINTAGATRFDELGDNLTHVVMEDKVESEINTINDMELRPHVVNALWLAECFRQARRVSEEQFLCPHFLLSDIELPKLRMTSRKSLLGRKKSSEGSKPSETSSASKTASDNRDEDGDDEMKELLSQYMDQGSSAGGGDLTVQPVDEVDGVTAELKSKQSAGGSSVNDREEDEDATQDPDSEMIATDGGIFGKKAFIFCGFSDDDVGALSEFVTQAGGVCLRAGKRKVPDYAVVPILGCPVRQTVGEVVTNAWLQMCIEAEELLPGDSNAIFRPMDIDESARPLEGCVLSVSGYSGVERDCLTHIAGILGAVCQEYFVRKANKSLQASTHLIVREPEGSKYNAARKWNIPAVAKEWLFACARSGRKADEGKFSIDNTHSTSLSAQTSHPQQTTPVAHCGSPSASKKPGSGKGTKGSTTSDSSIPAAETFQLNPQSKPQQTQSKDAGSLPKPSEVTRGQSEDEQLLKQRNATELASSAESVRSITATSVEKVPASSASDQEARDARSCDLADPMGSAKAMAQQQQSQGVQSQKENLKTPVGRKGSWAAAPTAGRKATHNRVEELQQQSRKPILSPGQDSPSVFLAPGFKPKFDLQGVFDYLKSPDVPQKRESLPLEEVFQHHIAEGVKNSSVRQNVDTMPASSQNSQPEDLGPLAGVVISVSKKLGVNQTEYNSIVVELGGDYNWQYSSSCTHFIFQGRANDLNKEFRQAKSQGKIIVSPYWLYACMEQRCRVDESMYHHSYNPNLNLGGVVRTESPSRALRRSARNTPRPGQDGTPAQSADPRTPTRPTADPKTPARAAADTWKESMEEMKKWQAGTSHTKSARGSSTKKRLGSVVEVSSTKETSPQTLDKASLSSEVKVQAGVSAASSAVSPSSDKSKSDKSAAEVEGLESHQEETESPLKETKEEGMVECSGSLEIREALSKTLEKMKACSSRSKKSSKKRNRRADGNSSGGQINTSGNLSDAASRHASPWQTKHNTEDAAHTTESLGEASQSLQITWDDPTGRREKERLAHKLDCAPSQNTEDFMAAMDLDDLSVGAKNGSSPQPQQQDRSPTPEPPPLAFPAARCLSKVASPQPVELLSEESCDSQTELSVKPIILTSGMGPQERIDYAEKIESMGGTLLEIQQFDPSCTHVVVVKPARNEKFLAAVATGRWVLHKSYLVACVKEGKFVREEDHEWGNPAMNHLMESLDMQTYSLVQAAYKWRQKLQHMKKTDPSCKGAFQGWRVILLTEQKREDNFRRLLSAGGASVLSVKPPFTELDATHAFVEPHKVRLSESDLEALVCGVDHVLKPEFIAAHLTDDPAPDPLNFTPAEIEGIRARLPDHQSKKRKGRRLSGSGSGKRPRR